MSCMICNNIIFFEFITACQTEVLSLQQMCIDKVAENLSYPRQVHLLRLPEYIKEKIVRVVFDPEVDFCRHLLDKRITHVDTIIDHESYKKLLSTTR